MSGLPKRCQSHYVGLQCAFVLAHDHPHGNEDSGVYVTWGQMASDQQPVVGTVVPETWQHALDDLWGCIGEREMEHLQPETVRLAKENHAKLWHNHDGPICMADGLPWWHPHHFATVRSPNEAGPSDSVGSAGLPFRLSCSSCGGGIRWCERQTRDTGEPCCRRCDCEESIKGWEGLRNA